MTLLTPLPSPQEQLALEPKRSIDEGNDGDHLVFLYKENNLAKLIGVAQAYLENNDPPVRFPETVPQGGASCGIYQCRDAEFWTCGFFPGSLYCLLERLIKHPRASVLQLCVKPSSDRDTKRLLITHLTALCKAWSAPLHAMSTRKDTHDLGFIVQPALRRDWELFGNQQSMESLLTAAESLASRFDERVGAIRSWDSFSNAHHKITSMKDDFLVIIDSLCNLDLLFYAGNYLSCPRLLAIAATHATTLLSTHLRKEPPHNGLERYSVYHAVNLSPLHNGAVKGKFTAQGYSDNSTWARGQAWAILGYAQTFSWTKNRKFLNAAQGLAEYFLSAMELSPEAVEEDPRTGRGRYVPLWDFDAPILDANTNGQSHRPIQSPLRDVSAGLIAACGMLTLYGQLVGIGEHTAAGRYLRYVVAVVNDTVAVAYNREEMYLKIHERDGRLRVETCGDAGGRFEAILEKSTANFNQDHADRNWNHGLVYADYYFLELGNRLLDMGLV